MQTIRASAVVLIGLAAFSLSACAGQKKSVLPQSISPQTSRRVAANGPAFRPGVVDRFAVSRGLNLSDSDLDQYITAPLSVADRSIAHHFMKLMPANLRGDFVYVDMQHGNRVISNNSELPNSLVVTTTLRTPATTPTLQSLLGPLSMPQRQTSSTRRGALDYTAPCAGTPPTPINPGGPYARYVSKCGYTTGWGFVDVPSQTSGMLADQYGNLIDNGYLYFEVTGERGSLIEGGLAYYTDTSIAGYAKYYNSSNNLITVLNLNNQSYRYGADQIIGVFSGLTDNQQQAYTIVGQLDSSQNPRTDWISSQVVRLDNPVWLFYSVPADFYDPGIDSAGYPTPCLGCTVTKLTTIGQKLQSTWSNDGSFFGVTDSGFNAINWIQVAFGSFESQCVPGAPVCNFDASRDPTVYGGGTQFYPNDSVSGESVGTTGYGPYETFDGIDLTGLSSFSQRRAVESISEPLPPPPCTADGLGYCFINTTATTTGGHVCIVQGAPKGVITYPGIVKTYYAIYNASGTQLEIAVNTR
jgi:hypothetical protein